MRTILEVICRRFPTIVWIALVVFAVAVAGTYLSTPQYVSEARITVPLGQESTLPATAMTPPLNVYINRAEQIQTQIEVLHSRSLVEKTIDALPEALFQPMRGEPAGLMARLRQQFRDLAGAAVLQLRTGLEKIGVLPVLSDRERFILNCADRLSAKRQRETDLIIITFRHPSPAIAQVFLSKFLEIYVREKTATDSGATVPFFAEQEGELEQRLVSARADLAAFRAKWGILDLSTQREGMLREYGRLTTEINEARAELVQNSVALKAFDAEPGKLSPESAMPMALRNDPGIIETLRNLASLRARESRLGTEMGENHPDRTNVQDEIRRLQGHIAEEGKNILGNRGSVLSSLLKELEAQRDAIQEQVLTLDARSREMRTLETTVDVMEAAVAQYAEKRETSRVSAAMDDRQINAIRVIEPPNLAYRPVSPKVPRNLLLGLICGIVAGLAYVFFRHQFSSTIYTPEDLQDCLSERAQGEEELADVGDQPAVAFLPDLNRPRAQGLLRRLLPSPSPHKYSTIDAVVKKMPENVMTMVGRKFFYPRYERHFPASLMLTGAGKNVGTTAGARLLAEHLSKLYSLRILLVDTAFDKPGKSGAVGVNGDVDFASWLRGASIAAPGEGHGVTVLSAGALDDAANAAFFSMTRESLAKLKGGYDMVVFDTAPVTWSSTSLHLAGLVEQVVLVVRSEVTRREVVRSTRETLEHGGGDLLGVICDFRRFYIPDWMYRIME